MDQPPYTTANFIEDTQKRLIDAAVGTLSETRLSWSQVSPLLDAGRAVCREDLRAGQLALHGLHYEGADLVPADEAYISVIARDRDTQVEWYSETYWLSDLALADRDPERVRLAIAALERSLAKLHAWVEANGEAADGEQATEVGTTPPPEIPED
jgi:hypothetical protein